ncbi:MAG TPA: hypothetical protein DCE14_03875 [Kosmotogaceae bacterium]|nr:MAG: DNA-directed DNA polymerase [Thermotogales bacterium 46_20]HAA85473.1 hypothetical protein [Kosmotogaceae bacterium]
MRFAFVISGEDTFESLITPEKLIVQLKKESYDGCVLIDSSLSSFPEWFEVFVSRGLKVVPGLREESRYILASGPDGLRDLIRYSNGIDDISSEMVLVQGPPKNIDESGVIWETRYCSSGEKTLLNAYREAGGLEPLDADYRLLSNDEYDRMLTPEISEVLSGLVPAEHLSIPAQVFPVRSSVEELRDRAMNRLRSENLHEDANYIQRLETELSVVARAGYCDYFATTEAIIRIAEEKGFWTGPGRGSAVGSLLVWALGITHIDPVKHGLYFERFLNSYRKDFPDIDIDIEDTSRKEMICELSERFGANKVALLETKTTFSFKSALRSIGRRMGITERQISEIIRGGVSAKTALVNHISSDLQRAVNWAKALEGFRSGVSIHAAGVILAGQDLREAIPVKEHEGMLVSYWGINALQKVRWQKLDILGLKNLRLLKELLNSVPPWREPASDVQAYKVLSSGFTTAIFQMERQEATRIVRKVRPRDIQDIALTIALNRPGPLRSGITNELISMRAKRAAGLLSHDSFSAATEDTFGLVVFQEQLIRLFVEDLGLDANAAEFLRRAISKKDRKMFNDALKLIDEEKITCSSEEARAIVENARSFAEYTFNKSHSYGYALLTYWMAYCKAKKPGVFYSQMMPLLPRESRTRAAAEARAMNMSFRLCSRGESTNENVIKILPADFLALGKAEDIASSMPQEESFHAFVMKHKGRFNAKELESLIRIGFLDKYGARKQMLKLMKSALAGVDPSLRSVLKLFGYKEQVKTEPEIDHEWEKALMENMLVGFNVTEFDAAVPERDVCDTTITRALACLDTGVAPFCLLVKDGKQYITDGKTLTEMSGKIPESGFVVFHSGTPSQRELVEEDEVIEVVRTYNHPVPDDLIEKCSSSNTLRLKIGNRHLSVRGARVLELPPDRIEVIKR